MKTYTALQLAEFAKMGYVVDTTGNLVKETRLQKIVRTSVAAQTIKSLELSESHKITERKEYETSSKEVIVTYTRVQDWFMDEERLARGLVTMRKPGVDYNLLPDGTKVCRCCQNRYESSNYTKAISTKDGLRSICRKCNSKQSKSYLEDKKNGTLKKI